MWCCTPNAESCDMLFWFLTVWRGVSFSKCASKIAHLNKKSLIGQWQVVIEGFQSYCATKIVALEAAEVALLLSFTTKTGMDVVPTALPWQQS